MAPDGGLKPTTSSSTFFLQGEEVPFELEHFGNILRFKMEETKNKSQ